MNTVIVTGAAGFLGSHLAELYLKNGYKVVGIDNFLCSDKKNVIQLHKKYKNFEFFEEDVSSDWDSFLPKRLEELEFIFHFASPASPKNYQRYPFETISANSVGLLNALNFAHRYDSRVIFASTSEVYGDPLVPKQSEFYWGNVNSFGPRACYDESKRLGEAIIFEFNRTKEARHGIVRIFNTYGPQMNHEDGRVIINFLLQAQQGEALTVYGDGQHTRSFCYVDDLINGVNLYARSGIVVPMNLGSPVEISIQELASYIQELYPEKKLKIQNLPLPTNDPRVRCPDISKAQSELSWRPTISLQQGLFRMKAWLEEKK